MRKKTHCSRLVKSGFEKELFSTAIRECPLPLSTSPDLRDGFRCPCLTCSIKITQVGIAEVVYSQQYGMDEQVKYIKPL